MSSLRINGSLTIKEVRTYIHFQNNVEPYTIFILFCEGIYL